MQDALCETDAPSAHSDEPDHVAASLPIVGSVHGFSAEPECAHVGYVSHVPSELQAIGLVPWTAYSVSHENVHQLVELAPRSGQFAPAVTPLSVTEIAEH